MSRPHRHPTRLATPERVRLRLDGAGYLGECVGRVAGLVVFAAYGVPGEEVVVELEERRSKFARGRVVEVLEPAPGRVDAPCPYYGSCGGCSWQHLDYGAELVLKAGIVSQQLTRVGGFSDLNILPIIGAADPWRYRNQARFSPTTTGGLGFTRRRERAVIDLDDCLLMQEPIGQKLRELRGHVGPVHQVVIRHGARTGDMLLDPPGAGAPAGESAEPPVTSYREVLLGRTFRVSTHSFFQVATRPTHPTPPAGVAVPDWAHTPPAGLSQADVLAALVLDRLALAGGEAVLDAYCGVGTFALLASPRAGRVVGIEESRSSVADAEANAVGVTGLTLHVGKVEAVLPALDEQFDAAVLDPARVGCAPESLAALLERPPHRLVYVSCDLATLARDLKVLCESAYRVVDVQPLDMFPRTHHVECVATLERQA